MTNPHKEPARSLAMAIDAIDVLIDATTDDWWLAHYTDLLDRLTTLHRAERDKADHWESERPRREAEARLAYHIKNDTLDLY